MHAHTFIRTTGNHVNEYARSAIYVARYHLLQGGGNLELARDFMEEVAASNSEEVATGVDLLRKVNIALTAKLEEEARMRAQGIPVRSPGAGTGTGSGTAASSSSSATMAVAGQPGAISGEAEG